MVLQAGECDCEVEEAQRLMACQILGVKKAVVDLVRRHRDPPTAPTEQGLIRSRRPERSGMTCSPRGTSRLCNFSAEAAGVLHC